MKQVWKFTLAIADGDQQLEMPLNAKILHVEMQGQDLCFWAEVWTDHEKEVRSFKVIGTGHPVNAGEHIGSVQMPPFVWHIYETTDG